MSEQEFNEQEHEEALKWANNLFNKLHGDGNPYHGVPHWEQTWELLHQMELAHVMSSAVDRVYVLGDIYLGTVEQVAKMSKEDVRRIIDTSKYQEQPLDRDTRFLGAAKSLTDEIMDLSVWTGTRDAITQHITEIIARRDYRFACHIVNFTSEQNLKRVRAGLWSVEQCVDQIPDMPEEPQS